MQLYDSHTHLNQEELFSRRQEELSLFIQAGGKGLVNAGANASYNEKGLLIAQESLSIFPDCWVKCSLGFHPCDVEQLQGTIEEEISQLKNQIIAHREQVVAIGECGIDLHYDKAGTTLPLQQQVFRGQCELARELKLPLVVHSRAAFPQTFAILQSYADLKIYFHCWGYGEEELQRLLEAFPYLFVGFCGNVSYPKAEALRASLKILPQEKMLIETDAPYLAPQAFRGQRNSPERVLQIGAYIAELLGKSEQELWQQVEKNFWECYGE